MKLLTYQHIINDDGHPVSEWVTDEEFDKREKHINEIIDLCRCSWTAMRLSENIQLKNESRD